MRLFKKPKCECGCGADYPLCTNLIEVYEKYSGDTKCYSANGVLVCRCGKCEPEDYPLPSDFNCKDHIDRLWKYLEDNYEPPTTLQPVETNDTAFLWLAMFAFGVAWTLGVLAIFDFIL